MPVTAMSPHPDADTQAFYDFVRGRSEVVPPGHDLRGLRLYRHLVWLGASQLIEAHHPTLREGLGEDGWRTLIADFVRQSTWTSPFLGDLHDDFLAYLAAQA